MFEIEHDITLIFEKKDYERNEFYDKIYSGDPSGETLYSGISFFFTSGIISIHCTDWSDSITREKRWIDNLRIYLKSPTFEDWLRGLH